MHFVLPPLAIFDFLGGGEIVLIFVVVLIFFGGDKLPEFARGFGKVMKEFRKAASEVEREFKNAMDEADKVKADATKTVTDDYGLSEIHKKITAPLNPPSVYTPAASSLPPESAPTPITPARTINPPEDDGQSHIDA
jgi:TatA/E family protein of Tat protein translocase